MHSPDYSILGRKRLFILIFCENFFFRIFLGIAVWNVPLNPSPLLSQNQRCADNFLVLPGSKINKIRLDVETEDKWLVADLS